MRHRLKDSAREVAALNFLLKKRNDGRSFLHGTLYMILAMRNDVLVPRNNTQLEEEWGEKFSQHKEIVDAVLHTIFHWFGTNVGSAELQKLAAMLKEFPNEPLQKKRT